MARDESKKTRLLNLLKGGNHRGNEESDSATQAPKKRRSILFGSGSFEDSSNPPKQEHRRATGPTPASRESAVPSSRGPSYERPKSLATSVNDKRKSRAEEPETRDADYRLPQVPHERDFSSGFGGLTLNSQRDGTSGKSSGDSNVPTPHLDEGRNSEHVADRNLAAANYQAPTLRLVPQPQNPPEEPERQPLAPNVDQHAGNAADCNVVQNDDAAIEERDEAPAPLKVNKRSSMLHSGAAADANSSHARDASWSITPLAMEGEMEESPLDARGRLSALNHEGPPAQPEIPRSSLDKPLPSIPRKPVHAENDLSNQTKQNSAGPMNLEGVDVRKDPDTVSLHEHHAPAVTHETVKAERHTVRQEVITRETHDHHIYHRILPIIDIEVKPARHFVPIQDGYVEIAEEELPGRTLERTNWAIAELVSQRLPKNRQLLASARGFTARTFEGPEFDDREYIGPEGHPVTEKWWVHPPTLCQDAYRAGQTYPFHLGSPNPADDGLKAKLPAGNIVGVSRRLMEKRQREAEQLSPAHAAGDGTTLVGA